MRQPGRVLFVKGHCAELRAKSDHNMAMRIRA
jgi:hypothetical protein